MEHTQPIQHTAPKDHSLALRARVCFLLRWNELQYGRLQYNAGLAYLIAYLKDEYYAEQVSKSKRFWSWWKNHWTLRDEAFTEHVESKGISVTTLEDLYLELHNGVRLTESIHPNAVVLEEGFEEMMHDLVKEEVCKS
jgi:hypothetical protein